MYLTLLEEKCVLENKRKTKMSTSLLFLFWSIPLMLVLLLPLYYKIIWPPIIGKPASASTVDVLAFWGAVFSGIITLVGVHLTIRFSQREIKMTLDQQERDNFIRGFGATVLEINSITFETKKFQNYLEQLKVNLEEYSHSGVFSEIVVEFDTKNDYKKIGNQVKPNLEIICNRFEGKAAHADGYVYKQITSLSGAIKKFQTDLYNIVDQLTKSKGEKNNIGNYESIFQEINQSISICENSLKDYKIKLGKRFSAYAEKEGYI